MGQSLPRLWVWTGSRDLIRHATGRKRLSMRNDTSRGSVIPSQCSGQALSAAKDLSAAVRAHGTLRMTMLGALLTAAACGRDQPDLGGRSDTTAASPAAAPLGQLAYVTNEDSQDLSV